MIPLDQLLIQGINGIVSGMILALVASGLTLIFGIMDVVNFAHGDLFMLGAYSGAVTLTATGSFWVALAVAGLTVGFVGAVMHSASFRRRSKGSGMAGPSSGCGGITAPVRGFEISPVGLK